MSAATIDDLRESLGVRTDEAAYRAKQWHAIPQAAVVVRETFILERVQGKRVLEFGASGPMHEAIVKVAASVTGVDRADGPGVLGFDLDDVSRQSLPGEGPYDVVVCGEVLEHLANPGHFLARLKRNYGGTTTILTVPNAHNAHNDGNVRRGFENVNIDHVAWYSHRTLQTLLERYGYAIEQFYWYRGQPATAEGLIVVTR